MTDEVFESKIDANTFPMIIHEIVRIKRCSYMDAMVDFCVEHGVEEEVAASMIDKSIKDHIDREGQSLNLLPKKKSLPFAGKKA